MNRLIPMALLLIAVIACGGDSGEDTTAPVDDTQPPPTTAPEGTSDPEGGDLPEPVCISEGEGPMPDFIGLTEAEARDLAEERDLSVREVGRDGECFPVTMDLRQDRINLEFAGDVVIGAAIY